MKQTFTDFSQLSKAMLKPAPKAEAQKSTPSKESSPPAAETPEQTIASLRTQLKEMEARYDAKRRECARLLAHLALSEQEVESLKGECGRLKGEAKKAALTKATTKEKKRKAAPTVASATPTYGTRQTLLLTRQKRRVPPL